MVLISAGVEDHKIPLWEQQLSCGAAGMNLLLAAEALGYVAGWVTGRRAYSERVRAAFCGRASASRASSSSAVPGARSRSDRGPIWPTCGSGGSRQIFELT